ncbi:MAG: hypothetical protein ABI282_03725 [Candidatus Baltobacteraceae bacterium]
MRDNEIVSHLFVIGVVNVGVLGVARARHRKSPKELTRPLPLGANVNLPFLHD